MTGRATGRRLSIAAGLASAIVLAAASLWWKDFVAQYHLARLRAEPAYLLDIIEKAAETPAGKAVRVHVAREAARMSFRAYLTEMVLDPHAGEIVRRAALDALREAIESDPVGE